MGKLIEKEGRFYKECGVVMLATDEASKVCLSTASVTHRLFIPVVNLALSDEALSKYKAAGTIPQHLYITSDDEIKDGDWFVNLSTNQVHQAGRYADICHKPEDKHCRKIIATTDSSIGYTDHRVSPVHNFCDYPKPSQSFILKYIEAYNKGEKIEKVLVEYSVIRRCVKCKSPYLVYVCTCGEQDNFEYFNVPKLKDNTITISKVKDSWTRDEVRMNLIYALSLFAAEKGLTPTSVEMKEVNDWTDKWINENL